MTAHAKENERWGSFAAYPEARKLCQEHVAGTTMHITWASYATRDELARVVAFYEKDQGKKAETGPQGELTIHAPARDRDVITVFPVEKAGDFPSCAEKPGRGERTVILVSSATGG